MISASAVSSSLYLRVVDRQRRQRAHLGPPVLALARGLEGAPPDGFGSIEVVSGPRDPPLEQQRACDRPRLAQALRGRQRSREHRLGGVQIRIDVDRHVPPETQRDRERPVIVELGPQFDRAIEDLGGRRILGQPIARLADPREGTSLANAPPVLGPGDRERTEVEIQRRAALHAAPGTIARRDQGVGRPIRGLAIRGVEVARRERGGLEMVGRPRQGTCLTQALGDDGVRPLTLALRQARVRDVAQDLLAEPPDGRGSRCSPRAR